MSVAQARRPYLPRADALYAAAAGRRGLRAAPSAKAHDEVLHNLDLCRMVTNRQAPRHGDLIGRRIGGYTIEALLGEGGMGSVYLARNSRLGRKVAIKVISREYTQNAEIVSRFLREAQAVAALDDPNIIDIIDCHEFPEDGLTYIAMKFIEGNSLAALLQLVRPMPLDGAIVIALQIASGLDAAHELGIVHRDVKPANVIISHRWRRRYFVTILDFGIAKLLDPYRAANFQNFHTNTSVVMGTLSYMAPEQARANRDVDARADVYSLGVVLYELLTGRLPYNEETIYGLVEKHARREPFPRPRELRREIPQVVDEALLDALQVDPRKRLPSMKEFGQRIAQGLPNGDRLLQTLAARLCVDRPSLPNEPTLTGDIESSITRWTPARSMMSARRPWIVPATVAVFAGAAIGATAMRMLTRSAADATEPASAIASARERGATPPGGHASDTPPVVERGAGASTAGGSTSRDPAPPDAAVTVASIVPDTRAAKTRPVTAPPRPEPPTPKTEPAAVKPAPQSTKPDAANPPEPQPMSADVASPRPEPAKPPAKPAPVRAERKPAPTAARPTGNPADAAADTATEGALVVRAHTWADVWVNGKRRGTAPLRLTLPAGRYVVRLTNDLHDETVTVQVGATEAVIEKSW
jgi:serine/threonine protein kinase